MRVFEVPYMHQVTSPIREGNIRYEADDLTI